VDLIVTDPPYMTKYLHVYEALAKIASQKLKPGGSIVFNYGNHIEFEIHKIFATYEDLEFWWRFCVYHEGAFTTRMHSKGVRVSWKPMMWFVKKGARRLTNYDLTDFIPSKPDKTEHPWAQSQIEAEYFTRYLTESEHSLVVDPFLGSGAYAIPPIKMGRYFIGIEIDKQTFDNTKNYIIKETSAQ
jgi:DNA modification methylase